MSTATVMSREPDTENARGVVGVPNAIAKQSEQMPTLGDAAALHGGLPRIVQLDGLRGLLALYVAIYHLATPLIRPGAALAMLHPMLNQAWFSVDVFFVMSGFVMMHVYRNDFKSGLNNRSVGRFLVARVARLYPVHVFAMLVMAVGVIPFIYRQPEFLDASSRLSWQSALASIFMLHSPWIDHRTWNYPAWSISAEWHAYLIFPLLVPVFAHYARRFSAATVLTAMCIPLCVYLLGDNDADRYPTNGLIVLMRVLPLFIAGMALHRLRELKMFRAHGAGSDRIAYGVLLFIVVAFLMPQLAPFAVVAIPLLIVTAISAPVFKKVLGYSVLLWLGQISYSLYMTHALIEMFFVNTVLRWSQRYFAVDLTQFGFASATLLLGAIGIALLAGWATWRWIEVPGRSMVNRLMTRAVIPATQPAIAT